MSVHTVSFPRDEGQAASREMLRRFDALAAVGPRAGAPDLAAVRRDLAALEGLDHQYGGSAPIDLEGTDELVDAALGGVSSLGDPGLVIAVALWAIRHRVAIGTVEPVVNALAERSNAAATAAELTAVFSLMQGVIAHIHDRLAADLERSNPERPWRVLHANLAITAIRTGDARLIGAAFDALDAALPDERAAFYAEALALALAPGFPEEVRALVGERHGRWTAR